MTTQNLDQASDESGVFELGTVTIEKNSRGYNWKIKVTEKTTLDSIKAAFDNAILINQMLVRRYEDGEPEEEPHKAD